MEGRDFLRLLANSNCLIGNSSVGIRECSHLGVPVVNIGTRQNRRQRGQNVIDINYIENEITEAINFQVNHGKYTPQNIYGNGQSGKGIADILAVAEPKINKTITY